MESPPKEIPTPTHDALKELSRLQTETASLRSYYDELAPHALSYENHRRQFTLLMWAHAPLTLFILVFAVAGGHIHTVQTVFFVYLVLFAAFALAVAVFGIQTHRIWMPRFFALALFSLSLWSTISVVYAVYTQIQMRKWYDILLLTAQGIDVAITVAYFYTAEMLAGVGGHVSAISAQMHYSGLQLSPITAQLGDAASTNEAVTRPSALLQALEWIDSRVSAKPGERRRLHQD